MLIKKNQIFKRKRRNFGKYKDQVTYAVDCSCFQNNSDYDQILNSSQKYYDLNMEIYNYVLEFIENPNYNIFQATITEMSYFLKRYSKYYFIFKIKSSKLFQILKFIIYSKPIKIFFFFF